MTINFYKISRIALAIFVVFSVVGFASPLFATIFPVETRGVYFGTRISVNDTDSTYSIADTNYLQGGHMQLAGHANLLTVTPERRSVGMLVTIVDDDGSTAGNQTVTYRLVSNRGGGAGCPTTVTDNSYDGKSSACATTVDANWAVAVPAINTANIGQVLTAITDTNGNNAFGWAALASGSGSGTVTSVGLALPSSLFSVSGSPITGAGTLSATLATQAANTVFAGPTTGSASGPSFRSLVVADLPSEVITDTLASGHFWLGDGSNIATAVTLSGDATMNSAGALTLADTGTSTGVFTNPIITVDTKGRIMGIISGSYGTISSVSNSDGSLAISPTTGAVVASLDVSHANTWTGLQTFSMTSTATSGTIYGTKITPTYNQTSGTASNIDLLINRLVSGGVGSGAQRLIDAQVNGTTKFWVTDAGDIGAATSVSAPSISANTLLTAASARIGNLNLSGAIPFTTGTIGALTQDGAFRWDATNHRLGIGTASPSAFLQIAGIGTATANNQSLGLSVTSSVFGRATSGDTFSAAAISPTLTAGANTQNLVGLLVNPTFSSGVSTGAHFYDAQFLGGGDVLASGLIDGASSFRSSLFAANRLVYTDANKTLQTLAGGTTGQVLTIDGSGNMTWGSGGGAGSLSVGDAIGSASYHQVFFADGTGDLAQSANFVFKNDANPIFAVGDFLGAGNKSVLKLNDTNKTFSYKIDAQAYLSIDRSTDDASYVFGDGAATGVTGYALKLTEDYDPIGIGYPTNKDAVIGINNVPYLSLHRGTISGQPYNEYALGDINGDTGLSIKLTDYYSGDRKIQLGDVAGAFNNTKITIDDVAGTIMLSPLAAGGLVVSDATGAIDNLATGTTGQVLTIDGSGNMVWGAGGGSGSLAIGDAIASATANRVFFADASGNLAQSNNFSFLPGGVNPTFDVGDSTGAGNSTRFLLDDSGEAIQLITSGMTLEVIGGASDTARISGSNTEFTVNNTTHALLYQAKNSGGNYVQSLKLDVLANEYTLGDVVASDAYGNGTRLIVDDGAQQIDLMSTSVKLSALSGAQGVVMTDASGVLSSLTAGTAGQVLLTDGIGNITWGSPTSGTLSIGDIIVSATPNKVFYANASGALMQNTAFDFQMNGAVPILKVGDDNLWVDAFAQKFALGDPVVNADGIAVTLNYDGTNKILFRGPQTPTSGTGSVTGAILGAFDGVNGVYSFGDLDSNRNDTKLVIDDAASLSTFTNDLAITALATTAPGLVLHDGTGKLTEMGLGTTGQVLSIDGSGNPAWTTIAGGGSLAIGAGVTGGTADRVLFIDGAGALMQSANFVFADGANPEFMVGDASSSGNGIVMDLNDATSMFSVFSATLGGGLTMNLGSRLYTLGDLSGANTELTIDGSAGTVTFSSHIGGTGTSGDTFLLDASNQTYSIGDLSALGNSTRLLVDDLQGSITLYGNDTLSFQDNAGNAFLDINITDDIYGIGNLTAGGAPYIAGLLLDGNTGYGGINTTHPQAALDIRARNTSVSGAVVFTGSGLNDISIDWSSFSGTLGDVVTAQMVGMEITIAAGGGTTAGMTVGDTITNMGPSAAAGSTGVITSIIDATTFTISTISGSFPVADNISHSSWGSSVYAIAFARDIFTFSSSAGSATITIPSAGTSFAVSSGFGMGASFASTNGHIYGDIFVITAVPGFTLRATNGSGDTQLTVTDDGRFSVYSALDMSLYGGTGRASSLNLKIDQANGVYAMGDLDNLNLGEGFIISDGGPTGTDWNALLVDASGQYFRVSPSVGMYGLGDLTGAYSGTNISIDDLTGDVINTISNAYRVADASANSFLSIDMASGAYSMGDLSGVGNSTQLSILDSTKAIVAVTDDTFAVSNVAANTFLSINQTAHTYGLGDLTGSFGGTTLIVDDSSLTVDINGDLHVVGSAATCDLGTSTSGAVCTSDARLKTNVQNLTSALDQINQLRPVSFNWIESKNAGATQIGFIAQDVQTIFPQFVHTIGKDGYLGIDYAGLIAPAIKAIQELDIKIEPLTTLDVSDSRSLASLIRQYLENALNGIGTIFAGKVQTKELCLDDVCLTKDQLKALLNQANVPDVIPHAAPSPTPAPTPSAEGGAPAGDGAASGPDPVVPEAPVEPTEPVVTPPEPPVVAPPAAETPEPNPQENTPVEAPQADPVTP